MKKIIIPCLIALCRVPAVAEWVLVETNEMGSVVGDSSSFLTWVGALAHSLAAGRTCEVGDGLSVHDAVGFAV